MHMQVYINNTHIYIYGESKAVSQTCRLVDLLYKCQLMFALRLLLTLISARRITAAAQASVGASVCVVNTFMLVYICVFVFQVYWVRADAATVVRRRHGGVTGLPPAAAATIIAHKFTVICVLVTVVVQLLLSLTSSHQNRRSLAASLAVGGAVLCAEVLNSIDRPATDRFMQAPSADSVLSNIASNRFALTDERVTLVTVVLVVIEQLCNFFFPFHSRQGRIIFFFFFFQIMLQQCKIFSVF